MEIAKKAEIIAVGSELLLGQIANTNAQFISKELAEIGVNVFYHTAVGDNPERLKQVIRIAEERSDLIIFSGGLGTDQGRFDERNHCKHTGASARSE